MNFLPCVSVAEGASTSYSANIKAGDLVIIYEGPNSMKGVIVDPKGRHENRFGVFQHKSWIGQPFGSKVTATQGGRGWVYLLRPTPELWTTVLRHRTQILYLADISMVVMQLELKPGCVVLESGTGSGSLTHSLVRAVAPRGHVHTFEFHAGRAEDAAAEFKQHGLGGLVTVTQRNIEELGFPDTLHGCADGVFLDLPGPHKVVPSAAQCLRPNGRFCSFSPCIEQVQRTCEALSAAGFTDVITYECLLREYEVHQEQQLTSIQLAPPPTPKRQRREPTPAGAAGASTAQEGAGPEAAAAAGQGAAAEGGEQGAGEPAVAESEAAGQGQQGEAKAEEQQEQGAPEAEAADGGEGAAGEGEPTSGSPAGSRWSAPSTTMRVVSCRPALEARGHTGYLTFARKFVTA